MKSISLSIAFGLLYMSLGFMLTFSFYESKINKKLCEYSKYATTEFKVINGNVYCEYKGSYYPLAKHKPKSKHNLEHRSDNNG